MRVWVGDKIFSELGVEVEGIVTAEYRIEADGDAVGEFVRVVGMHQHSHRCRHVIDAMEFAFGERAEVPQAGIHLFERLGDAVLLGLVGMLGFGVVEASAVKPGAGPRCRCWTGSETRSQQGRTRASPSALS